MMKMTNGWWKALFSLLDTLSNARIDYTLLNTTALLIQGANISDTHTIDIEVQWDLFPRCHELLAPDSKIETEHDDGECFHFIHEQIPVTLFCFHNTVVSTDPYRLATKQTDSNQILWAKSLDYYTKKLPISHPWVEAIHAYWHSIQQQNNRINAVAWNQEAYNAWLHRLGTPQEMAARLRQDPHKRLGALATYLGTLEGKKVINLLGSHGSKAIAMALLGAHVTVVDISRENAQYAQDVAQAANIELRYLISDVLSLAENEINSSYDLVVMELGILHYFVDLAPLAELVFRLLRPHGRLILQDFHPISTKLITSTGKKHKVNGNYFDKTLHDTPVAFSKHLPTEQQTSTKKVYQRRWTLGEIVTAFASSGLFIRQLEEEPNAKIDDIGLPKLFTLVAERLPYQFTT
jgi:2-polyprenyl-3-methyl-5-hydroxy-6-metoxy-1,4-benzoquinol methylase